MNIIERLQDAQKHVTENPEGIFLIADACQSLDQMDNTEITSAFSAVIGFGRIRPANYSFEKLREAGLIKEDGSPANLEVLILALYTEMKIRDKAKQ
jgi:hypothetical protein